jgi:hypothetical protein
MPRRNFLDTLRALQQRWGDALKLRMLRKRIKTGVEALERGDFTEVDDAELDTYLEEQLRVENASHRRAPRLQEPRR